ncbi:hypothetical protein DV737_g1887, partial [Chaetothyriales sp. CBS 132003]
MADTDTGASQTSAHGRLLQQMSSFIQSAPQGQVNALERFITTKPVPMSETPGISIIPPAEEVRIRLEKINLEESDVQKEMLDTLTIWYGDPSAQLEYGCENGIVAASHVKSHHQLLSGQIFEVHFDGKDSKEDAEKMKHMVDLQWALIVMASIAGAADPPELDDSDDDDSDEGFIEVDPDTMYDDGTVQQ